jgi:hypothetical protein
MLLKHVLIMQVLLLQTISNMKSTIFCDVMPCSLVDTCISRRFRGTSANLHQPTRSHMAEDSTLHSHRRENFRFTFE